MSSVHRIKGKPNWACFYTDRDGRRRCKSTLTANKREAERICSEVQKIEDRAKAGHITHDRARRVIEGVVSEIMESVGAPLERKTIREHFERWLKAFESECREGTFLRYDGIVKRFLAFLGPKANRTLASLTSDDIEAYRDELSGSVASRTVNVHLKVLRVGLEKAVKQRVFDMNPARLVDNVDTSDRHERRAFSLAELKRLLGVAGDDWKTAILFGVYTGLRLGDISSLTWANLDLQNVELSIRTQKTGRFQPLPIARPLARHIESLTVSDNPRAPLCPSLFEKPIGWLSNQFFELMASAGLVQSRGTHQKKHGKQGRGARRKLSELSFHSIRHTATSLLKNAGVSDVIARDIIGHESEAISRNYTHIESETKRRALNKMPDIL